jgi:lipopolysaccharide transport system ATP-binding protein
MLSEVAINVHTVTKTFVSYKKPYLKILECLGFPRIVDQDVFCALNNISFQVKKGETVGVIGKNGSGKSTLLQLITGVMSPSSGSIHTNGRIAALLELGSGFNPEFTGKQNVYMNASLLGLSRQEIDERYHDIVDFADIGDFIDKPVKVYSSGMLVRLAFAVQAQINPDILIIDEALAVGDAKFQAKCFDRLKSLQQSGTSILLVTHSIEQIVAHCDRAILLDNGNLIIQGAPKLIANIYMDILFGKTKRIDAKHLETYEICNVIEIDDSQVMPYGLSNENDVFNTRPCYNPYEHRWGDGEATILDFATIQDNREYPVIINSGHMLTIIFIVKFNGSVNRPIFGITIKSKEGITIYGSNSELLNVCNVNNIGARGQVVSIKSSLICLLAPGDYFVSLGVASIKHEITPHDRRYDSIHIRVADNCNFFGLVDLSLNMSIADA